MQALDGTAHQSRKLVPLEINFVACASPLKIYGNGCEITIMVD